MNTDRVSQAVWGLGVLCALAGWHSGFNPFLWMLGGMLIGSIALAYADAFKKGGPPSTPAT